MSEFKKFKDIIDRYYDSINLGSPSNAPSEERIAETEKNLEVKLPPSYIWFLTHFGGGDILGDEIYSIYNNRDAVGGDITFQYQNCLASKLLNKDEIPILCNDYGEIYLFHCQKGPEFPIYKKLGKQRIFYANNFAEFLEKLLKEYFSD